ncbi:fibronectin type III domain-containing protein [Ketobacter sp.]|uniref:fibronectin type III domain-containing protein n=1 Tax=Ketobacter sp. TaxID=2083498 RepID=UPI000F2C149E|nr:Ig-like domain-containing protein [Ketobacter sp.]RLT96922.1 MAG: fibronectin type III domain-containing protein [Ketobacter sp.]
MNFRSAIFVGCILSLSAPSLALAARNPCTADGQLKRWAQNTYDANYCSNTDANTVTNTAANTETNTAPVLAVLSPATGSTITAGTTLNLRASAMDKEDGDLSSKVFWYSSRDGKITSTPVLSIGEHTLHAAVYDSDGEVAKTSIKLSVIEKPNTAPNLAITSPAHQSAFTTEQVLSLQATASDAEDGDLGATVVWTSSLDGRIQANTSLTAGTHIITASVSDSGALTTRDTITVNVTEPVQNTAPSLSIVAPTNGSTIEAGGPVSLQANAMDKEDGDISNNVFWYSSRDGKITSTPVLSIGEHTLYAAVYDRDGEVTKTSIKLSVVEKANTPPSLAITSPANQSTFTTEQVLSLKATASDAEDGDLGATVVWTSSLDGRIQSNTSLSAGTHIITALVSDSGALTAQDTITVSISEILENSAPSLSIVFPTHGSSVTAGSPLTLKATAIDNEDGDISNKVFWYSSVDGQIDATTALSAGEHTLYAAVYDSDGEVTKTSIKLSAVEEASNNNAPTVTIQSPASGHVVEEGTALLLKANAFDVEDGDLSGQVSWYSSLDGTVGNLTTLSIGEHTLTARVQDANGLTAEDQITLSVVAQTVVPDSHSITVSWVAPTSRADGSQLRASELAGYRILWTNATTGSSGTVDVDGGATTFHEIDDLETGRYRITLNSVDNNGLVSLASEEITIDLR